MLLAAAGLTRGRPAVTHHDALSDLAATGTHVIEDARVVDDGDLLTAAGVTSGLDLALWIIERGYAGRPAERLVILPRVPVSFRLPALACWAILFPLGS
jgi:transcriptional regulator GlxA family with amidase domain